MILVSLNHSVLQVTMSTTPTPLVKIVPHSAYYAHFLLSVRNVQVDISWMEPLVWPLALIPPIALLIQPLDTV